MVTEDRLTSRARRFRYLADPICVGSLILYAIGRWYLRPAGIGGAFVRGYLNDVLCLPLFLPMILRAQTILRLRRHDGPPRLWEVLQHWVVFSVIFEVILPRYPEYFRTTADPLDVLAYLAGGMGAWAWWRVTHRSRAGIAVRQDAGESLVACPPPVS